MAKLLYVVGAFQKGPVKVGITGMLIEHRINNLQPGNPHKLRAFKTWECVVPWVAEMAAHRLLKARRLHNEWFRVSADEAIAAVEEAIRLTEPLSAVPDPPRARERARAAEDLWKTDKSLNADDIAERVGLSTKTLYAYLGPREIGGYDRVGPHSGEYLNDQ